MSFFRVGESELLSEFSDVYSFGVFLLELVSGDEVSKVNFFGSGENLIKWVNKHSLCSFLLTRFLLSFHS